MTKAACSPREQAAFDVCGASADAVQPAHGSAVAGVAEGLELLVPGGAEQLGHLGPELLRVAWLATRALRRRSSLTTASPLAEVQV